MEAHTANGSPDESNMIITVSSYSSAEERDNESVMRREQQKLEEEIHENFDGLGFYSKEFEVRHQIKKEIEAKAKKNVSNGDHDNQDDQMDILSEVHSDDSVKIKQLKILALKRVEERK